MLNVLFVGIGGFLGAISRFSLGQAIDKLMPGHISIGILSINTIGAFLISVLFFSFEEQYFPPYMQHLISVGFLGAFTTFSTYTLHSFELLRNGQVAMGLLNILLNNVLSLSFALFGMLTALFLRKFIFGLE